MKNLLLIILFFSILSILGYRSLILNRENSSLLSNLKTQTNDDNDPFSKKNWGLLAINLNKTLINKNRKKKITIAVIDTGTDINHEYLKHNIWKNKGEIAFNGIDDDGNGFIDDVNGWNFVENNNNLTDNHGHGTHIAGIIGAVSKNVSIMVLKYYDPKSKNEYSPFEALLSSIEYAIQNGADIINYSGGGSGFSAKEFALLKKAEDKGILVITAAGNESNNTDKISYYPSCYRLSNMISVASVNKNNTLIESSNYGSSSVDIAAPGDDIYSTLPDNKYGLLTGTSQATAFVTGAASIILSQHPELSFTKIKKILLSNVHKNKALYGKLVSGGVLDIANSLSTKLALK